jgi:U3 small nucleolar RNA-associated protein 13
VRVWSAVNGKCYGVGVGHTDSVGAVVLSQNLTNYTSNQNYMVSGAADKVLKRWSVPVKKWTGNIGDNEYGLVATHSVRAHEKDINSVAISPTDSIVASASHDKSIRIWRGTDLFAVATLRGHKRGVWCVKFSTVDKSLVSCSGDRTVKLWSLTDFSCTRSFEGHAAGVLAVAFVRHGQQIVSASADGLVKLWTIRTGECENTMDEHEDKIWTLAATEGAGQVFFTGGSDSTVKMWKDTTQIAEETRLREKEKSLLKEQEMQNDIRNKRYGKVGGILASHVFDLT